MTPRKPQKRRRARAPSNALLAKALYLLSQRVEVLEEHARPARLGFKTTPGEYEGSVGGNVVEQTPPEDASGEHHGVSPRG